MINYQELIKACNSVNNPYIEALILRGFLVDKRDDGFYLSKDSFDESCSKIDYMFKEVIPDSKYLIQILTNYVTLSDSHKIIIKEGIDLKTFCHELFDNVLEIQGEAGYLLFRKKFNYFCRYGRSFKIPVACLEPFIARLVRAFSLVGISTYSSCNGLGPSKNNSMHVGFIGIFHGLWAKNIFGIILKTLGQSIKNTYKFEPTSLTIKYDLKNYLEVYSEIHRIANFIIDKKDTLLDFKRQFCSYYGNEIKKLVGKNSDLDETIITKIDKTMNQFLHDAKIN